MLQRDYSKINEREKRKAIIMQFDLMKLIYFVLLNTDDEDS
jgi:hypothetical protein